MDLPSAGKNDHSLTDHRREEFTHEIIVEEDTRLSSILGDQCKVNSFHHQAIETPAPSLTISAFSEDGIIEGAEKNRVLAVQWHPERLLDQKEQVRIAGAFLSMCASARDTGE